MKRLWIPLVMIMLFVFCVSMNRRPLQKESVKIERNSHSLITKKENMTRYNELIDLDRLYYKELEERMKTLGVLDYCIAEDWVYYDTNNQLEPPIPAKYYKLNLTDCTIEKVVLADDIRIENLTFGHTYKEVKDQLGEPTVIVPILDEGVVLNKGHFVILEYPGLEYIVDTRLEEVENGSSVVEITVTGENYYTPEHFTVGSTKEDLKKVYQLEEKDFIDKTDEHLLDRIQGLRRENHTVPDYDESAVIRAADSPVVLLYLLKEGQVVSMLIRHLSAD